MRLVHERHALAPQPPRNPHLLPQRIRLRVLDDDPEPRHELAHLLEIVAAAQDHVRGVRVDPVQFDEDVADVGADAEVTQLPGIDRHAAAVSHARPVPSPADTT